MRRWWLLAGLGAAVLLISARQTWVSATVQDPVLGHSVVEATGSQAGSTLTAGALLAGAALLAGLVGSRPVRLVAGVCLAGGAALAGAPALRAVTDPAAIGGAVAADRPGATGLTVQIQEAQATLWPWVALLGAALILLGAILCLGHWLATRRADRHGPRTPQDEGGRRRREPPRDPWQDLTDGQDPTLG